MLSEQKKFAAAPDEPHIHDFEELIVGMKGKLEHFVDFRSVTVEAPLISFIAKGKAHRVAYQDWVPLNR